MARKTFVDLSDTLNAFRVKTNVISFNVGDLDSLHSSLPDSDLVQAINHLRIGIDSNQTQIFNNDSDIANISIARTSTLSILKSDGTIAKRIFGFIDSGV